ncbi:hypothetical protein BN1708_020151, partial [Verticillium longisporum]
PRHPRRACRPAHHLPPVPRPGPGGRAA